MKPVQRQQKQMRVWSRFSATVLLALLVVLAAEGNGLAGTTLGEAVEASAAKKEIQLLGATEFGTVQLFQYLLTRVEGVETVEPLGMRITPEEPQACRAAWQVAADTREPAEIVRQLVAIIKELDPDKQNTVLYEAPFVVAEQDVELLKRAEPLDISTRDAVFVIGSPGEVAVEKYESTPNNRWMALPGAGFD